MEQYWNSTVPNDNTNLPYVQSMHVHGYNVYTTSTSDNLKYKN